MPLLFTRVARRLKDSMDEFYERMEDAEAGRRDKFGRKTKAWYEHDYERQRREKKRKARAEEKKRKQAGKEGSAEMDGGLGEGNGTGEGSQRGSRSGGRSGQRSSVRDFGGDGAAPPVMEPVVEEGPEREVGSNEDPKPDEPAAGHGNAPSPEAPAADVSPMLSEISLGSMERRRQAAEDKAKAKKEGPADSEDEDAESSGDESGTDGSTPGSRSRRGSTAAEVGDKGPNLRGGAHDLDDADGEFDSGNDNDVGNGYGYNEHEDFDNEYAYADEPEPKVESRRRRPYAGPAHTDKHFLSPLDETIPQREGRRYAGPAHADEHIGRQPKKIIPDRRPQRYAGFKHKEAFTTAPNAPREADQRPRKTWKQEIPPGVKRNSEAKHGQHWNHIPRNTGRHQHQTGRSHKFQESQRPFLGRPTRPSFFASLGTTESPTFAPDDGPSRANNSKTPPDWTGLQVSSDSSDSESDSDIEWSEVQESKKGKGGKAKATKSNWKNTAKKMQGKSGKDARKKPESSDDSDTEYSEVRVPKKKATSTSKPEKGTAKKPAENRKPKSGKGTAKKPQRNVSPKRDVSPPPYEDIAYPPLNHYATLGLESNATQQEIEATVKRLRRTTHPDKLFKPGMSEEEKAAINARAQNINQAASELMDPEKKQEYDDGVKEWTRKYGKLPG